MAYALLISSPEHGSILEHVANSYDDSVYFEDAELYGLPQSEWRKPYHLTSWVKQNYPHWRIEEKHFSIEKSFTYLTK